MSLNAVILALVLYPLLYVLRISPIHVQWVFKKGLAPMPPELEKRAEATDRVMLFFADLILLVVVVLLMHGSLTSAYEVGLTSENWKSALGMGAMLSLLPLGLIELLLPKVPPEVAGKEPESCGPVATWCGLITLGSFSAEFWRAFCIVALIRLGLSAWLAVVIAAVFFAAVSLQTSIAKALGAAAFGGAAGFLFVYTGSLLAPLTMSLIVGGASLYRVRHASCPVAQHSAAVLKESTVPEQEAPVSRYSVTCPTCGTNFRPRQFLWGSKGDFHCPVCGELLEYARGSGSGSALFFYITMLILGSIFYFLGYRGLVLILIIIAGSIMINVIGILLLFYIWPPKVQLCLRDGDTGLRLRDVPHRGEDHQARKN